MRAGEIVGLAGLVGSGRSEVAQAIFGLDPARAGRFEVDGQPLRLGAVRRGACAAASGWCPRIASDRGWC